MGSYDWCTYVTAILLPQLIYYCSPSLNFHPKHWKSHLFIIPTLIFFQNSNINLIFYVHFLRTKIPIWFFSFSFFLLGWYYIRIHRYTQHTHFVLIGHHYIFEYYISQENVWYTWGKYTYILVLIVQSFSKKMPTHNSWLTKTSSW